MVRLPAVFDQGVGAGAAADIPLLQGYDVNYENSSTSESIESTLFAFASSADALLFEPEVLSIVGAATLEPRSAALSAVPGSVVLISSKAGSDGFYLVDVVDVRGQTIMVVEYRQRLTTTGVPQILSTSASVQYKPL